MAGIEPAVDADGGTLSPNNKRPMINEAGKQTKVLHSLLTPESTPGPETARIEADKGHRQAEATKELSNQLHSEQASNKDLAAEPEQFANNAQGDKIQTMRSLRWCSRRAKLRSQNQSFALHLRKSKRTSLISRKLPRKD